VPHNLPAPEHKHFLDAQGLLCPLPILKAKKILNSLARGEILEVWATDPAALPDFRAFCAQTGHTLSQHEAIKQGQVIRICIEKR
jgi:tRNA 2-thiouridine synthesizing protein A